jgi:polyisoprenoid-binding protein YceI
MLTRFLAAMTLAAALAVAALVPAQAAAWTIVPAESKIAFSGEHAGTKFKGTFEKWDAVIAFDPANLAASKATVTVQLASAKTGDTTYDKTLPTIDWFDIAKGPTGVFETTGFRSLGADKYEADATLSLRGIKMPVVFTFDFKATGDTAKLIGKAEVKRMDFGIGKTSDATGAWVSLSIPLEVTVGLKKG